MSPAPVALVVAVDRDGGIGKKNGIPWRLPPDVRHFKRLTRGPGHGPERNAVIMGRKTWQSLPPRFRPLPGRLNVVLTRSDALGLQDGVLRAGSLDHALELVDGRDGIDRIFIIGGVEVYRAALDHERVREAYITRIDKGFECDVFFPALGPGFALAEVLEAGTHGDMGYRIERWSVDGAAGEGSAAAGEGAGAAGEAGAGSGSGGRGAATADSSLGPQRRSERCIIWSEPRSGLHAILVMDDTTLGPAVGGTRTRRYSTLGAAMDDAARLARAMTLKCSLGGLDAGGAKIVVLENPDMDREAAFEQLGRYLEGLAGQMFTAGDLGTTAADIAALGRHTSYVHQGGDVLADSLARGLAGCLRAAWRFAGAGDELAGVRVAVQGCGSVGAAVARELGRRGAELVIADIDRARADALGRELGARVEPPEAIVSAPVDVFCPCATGGVVTVALARAMSARVVCGAANNILARPEAGQVLHARGIVFVPDILSSAGAVIDGIGERLMGLADRAPLLDGLGETTAKVLERSRALDEPPEVVAETMAWDRIRAAAAARRS